MGLTQVGYVLGRTSPFAHLNSTTFQPNFVQPRLDSEMPIQHAVWLKRVAERRDSSDEAFVTHFRSSYDDQMPIWALTEILELGQLSRLYKGLNDESSLEIAQAFNLDPPIRLMARGSLGFECERGARAGSSVPVSHRSLPHR
ncbi:Abi family protein [Brevibacterium aurantiacum]|uniref:Abi family protein n=1 Tax=Brevibacterium aurantiacum TaxID=273384 RepID=UPI001F457754|nr:Abi family protein [Brevibacterium aurantiacum]